MKRLTIRPLERSDKSDWQILWTAYIEFYQTSLHAQMYDLAFERLLSDDENEFRGMIAHLDDRPVGLVHTLAHRHGWLAEKVIYLQDLYVSPDARGKGIGRALIEEIYRQADIAGTPNVYWLTASDNKAARKLYDRIGQNTGFIKYARPGPEE